MTGNWREFTFAVDACPARELTATDLEHIRRVAERTEETHDVVCVYDEDSRRLTVVGQLEALTPGTAAVRGCENVKALLGSIGLKGTRVRLDGVSVEPAGDIDEEYFQSREDYQTTPI